VSKTASFQGRAVLVTGASRGLGAALIRAFASAGARVVGVAREAGALHEVVRTIRQEGGEAHGIVADVAELGAAARIAGQAAALVGPVDILVHNASSLGPVPLVPLSQTDDVAWLKALETNLSAPFRLTRAVVGGMALRQRGLVVHITSDAATTAYPGWGAYGVSKAALEHLARIWDVELSRSGVHFTNIDPGEMDTHMHREAVPGADPGSLSRPEDVAHRILALLSGEAGPAASGAVLRV
jgi:NAD(P)-dependent dehydrogenase (short-subunit alcohol dehydrogenase family)